MLRDSRPRPPKPIRKMPTDPKPTLELHRLPVFRVHYKALEAYIEKVFAFEFDFLMAAGVSEGVGVDYEVTGVPDSYEWRRRADQLRMGNRTREVRLILAVLADGGYIPKGKYTVSTKPLPDPTLQYRSLLQRIGDPLHPDALRFKEAHKGDREFNARAAILDQAMSDHAKQP